MSLIALFLADILLIFYIIDLKTIYEEKNENFGELHPKVLSKFRILHIINPFETSSEQGRSAQNMTIISIENALSMVPQLSRREDLNVAVLSIDFAHAPSITTSYSIPRSFHRRQITLTSDIEVPQLASILTVGYEYALQNNYTHVIYTNMDISIVPSFYRMVELLLKCSETLLINR